MNDDFRRKVLKLNEPRKHKVRNSVGVYDIYKSIRKNKWYNIGRPVKEHEFYSVVRQINNHLADVLLSGRDIILPHRLGNIEIRKYDAKMSLVDGKLKTNLPIDWDRTLKLWSEDEESYKERTLVKMEEKEIFKVYYNKSKANYQNKSFYDFECNRDLKRRLKQKIKNGALDAYKFHD